MISSLKHAWDGLWGRGDFSVTVPIMDGALRPNNALDGAETLWTGADVDNLAALDGRLLLSQGPRLLAITASGATPQLVEELSSDISAIAVAADGSIVVALDDGVVLTRAVAEEGDWKPIDFAGQPAHVTAMAFAPTGDLYICTGSRTNRASRWKHDLMQRGASGSLWILRTGERTPSRLADGLAWPSGIGFLGDGRVLVSEAWKHRIVSVGPSDRPVSVLADLPGYPGRMVSRGDTTWLCVFAPRSQMIEFVLREKAYREQMVSTVDERFWMAPTLRAGRNFKEPVQGGGIRHLGIQKPWGPTRSYGLVVRIEGGTRITASFHSRSDGNRHGMTSIADWSGGLVASSRGDGAIILLPGEGGKP